MCCIKLCKQSISAYIEGQEAPLTSSGRRDGNQQSSGDYLSADPAGAKPALVGSRATFICPVTYQELRLRSENLAKGLISWVWQTWFVYVDKP